MLDVESSTRFPTTLPCIRCRPTPSSEASTVSDATTPQNHPSSPPGDSAIFLGDPSEPRLWFPWGPM